MKEPVAVCLFMSTHLPITWHGPELLMWIQRALKLIDQILRVQCVFNLVCSGNLADFATDTTSAITKITQLKD
jgi:hypothetical protein